MELGVRSARGRAGRMTLQFFMPLASRSCTSGGHKRRVRHTTKSVRKWPLFCTGNCWHLTCIADAVALL